MRRKRSARGFNATVSIGNEKSRLKRRLFPFGGGGGSCDPPASQARRRSGRCAACGASDRPSVRPSSVALGRSAARGMPRDSPASPPVPRFQRHSQHRKRKKPPKKAAFPVWWRRGELNPRPQALRLVIYMLSRMFFSRLAERPPAGTLRDQSGSFRCRRQTRSALDFVILTHLYRPRTEGRVVKQPLGC